MNRRNISIGLISAGLLLFILAMGFTAYNHEINNPDPIPLPEEIAGWHLITAAQGSQAVNEIARLHGKGFPLTSGAVGMYGAGRQIKIWVSGTLLKAMAAQMVTSMAEKISESSSPFTPIGQYQEGNRTIYELEGLGQKHYYFQSGNLVIWLAAAPEIKEEALQQIREFYP
jgi:hypothetical protein